MFKIQRLSLHSPIYQFAYILLSVGHYLLGRLNEFRFRLNAFIIIQKGLLTLGSFFEMSLDRIQTSENAGTFIVGVNGFNYI